MCAMTSGRDFFGHQKNLRKNQPLKNHLFSIFEPFWEALCADFVDFGVQKGGPGRSMFNCFCHRVFDMNFAPFVAKKNKGQGCVGMANIGQTNVH